MPRPASPRATVGEIADVTEDAASATESEVHLGHDGGSPSGRVDTAPMHRRRVSALSQGCGRGGARVPRTAQALARPGLALSQYLQLLRPASPFARQARLRVGATGLGLGGPSQVREFRASRVSPARGCDTRAVVNAGRRPPLSASCSVSAAEAPGSLPQLRRKGCTGTSQGGYARLQ